MSDQGITSIEVGFGAPVSTPAGWERRFADLLDELCNAYEAEHPDRVMWPAGWGAKITSIPMTREDDIAGMPMEFDGDVLSVECFERERYETERKGPRRRGKPVDVRYWGALKDGAWRIYETTEGGTREIASAQNEWQAALINVALNTLVAAKIEAAQ